MGNEPHGVTTRWRELLDSRTDEAVQALCAVEGVEDVVVGGSVGRDEPWPLSDIDVIPIVEGSVDAVLPGIAAARDELVGWWAASGRAQTLDVGWLAFTTQEVAAAIVGGAEWRARHMRDARWIHGVDKASGGRGATPGGPGGRFAFFATSTEWAAEVRIARQQIWLDRAQTALADAHAALSAGDPARAAEHAAGIGQLSLALMAAWGERDSSMGRAITRFERIARRHGHGELVERLAEVTGSSVVEVNARAPDLPAWLQARVDMAYEARRAIGEDVSYEENRRDQILAFGWLAARRKSIHAGDWASRRPVADPELLVGKAVDLERDIRRLVAGDRPLPR